MSAKAKSRKTKTETDGTYFLKLVLYLVIGTQWVWLEHSGSQRIPIPVGAVLGLIFAIHDHFQIDRKIEYAVLITAMLVGYAATIGVFIQI